MPQTRKGINPYRSDYEDIHSIQQSRIFTCRRRRQQHQQQQQPVRREDALPPHHWGVPSANEVPAWLYLLRRSLIPWTGLGPSTISLSDNPTTTLSASATCPDSSTVPPFHSDEQRKRWTMLSQPTPAEHTQRNPFFVQSEGPIQPTPSEFSY